MSSLSRFKIFQTSTHLTSACRALYAAAIPVIVQYTSHCACQKRTRRRVRRTSDDDIYLWCIQILMVQGPYSPNWCRICTVPNKQAKFGTTGKPQHGPALTGLRCGQAFQTARTKSGRQSGRNQMLPEAAKSQDPAAPAVKETKYLEILEIYAPRKSRFKICPPPCASSPRQTYSLQPRIATAAPITLQHRRLRQHG